MMTKTPEREEVVLGKPVHGGACLGHLADGRTAFVRGGVPGERVRVKVTSEHKRFVWAEVVEVLDASPHRVPHIWPEAAQAGFELGHVTPQFQREWKGAVLTDQLRRVGGQEVVEQVEAATPSPDRMPHDRDDDRVGQILVPVAPAPGDEDDARLAHRRTRLQLVANARGRLGLRKYRSHDIVPLSDLPVADQAICDLNILDDPRWRRVWTPGERIGVEAPNHSGAIVVTSSGVYTDPDTAMAGPSQWEVSARGRKHTFSVRPGSFWQTHRQAPSVLVEAVLEGAHVQSNDVVAELYSGSGLFSRFLVDELHGGELLTLEGNSDAVASAGATLEDVITADRAQVFEGAINAESVGELFAAAKSPVTTVVLDPPRTGASRPVVEAICASTARRVVLVSCDPAAGARDLADFIAGGFRIEKIAAWDLFPHTHHFEVVATLTR